MDNSTGVIGEQFIYELLKSKGYTINRRNFKTRYGEIDMIASDDKYIIFIEVKTRFAGSMNHPLEAVTKNKQKKIIFAAQEYLQKNSCPLQPRFDVAAVYTVNKEVTGYDYITNAFTV